MPESFVETQVRLVLEQQCAAAFNALRLGPLRGFDFTLLFLDHGDGGNGAFKTTLSPRVLIATFEDLLEAWRTHRPRGGSGSAWWRLAQLDIRSVGGSIQTPAGVGYALLVGRWSCVSYIATCGREGVAETIEKELLPWWREAVKRA